MRSRDVYIDGTYNQGPVDDDRIIMGRDPLVDERLSAADGRYLFPHNLHPVGSR